MGLVIPSGSFLFYTYFNKGEDITITCKFCGKQCKQSIISRHIRMAHPKECFEEKALNTPGLKCSICDERYLQKSGKAFFTIIYSHSSCGRQAVSRLAVV